MFLKIIILALLLHILTMYSKSVKTTLKIVLISCAFSLLDVAYNESAPYKNKYEGSFHHRDVAKY